MGFGSNKGFTPGGELTVKEIDGAPDVKGVQVIRVSNGTLTDDSNGQVTIDTSGGGAGAGDVVGPASAVDNAVARFDTTTGKLLQNSTLLVSDAAAIGVAGDLDLIVPASGTVTFNIGDVAGSDLKIINAGGTSVLHVEGDTQTVGIGEAAPSSKLHILDADKTLTLEKSATGFFNSFGFDVSIPYVTYYSSVGGGMKLGYGESTGGPPTVNTMFLNNIGRVGIGTLTPSAKLNLETTASTVMHISRDGSASTVFNSANWALGTVGFGGQDTDSGEDNDAALIEVKTAAAWTATGHGTYMAFSTTADDAVATTERMRIESDGFVGIGNTAPASELHIGAAASTVKQVLTIENDNGHSEIGMAGGGSDILPTAAAGDLVISNENGNDILLGTSNVQRMIIDSAGNVGIGVMDPPNYLLEIDGTCDHGDTTTFNNGTIGLIGWNVGNHEWIYRAAAGIDISWGGDNKNDQMYLSGSTGFLGIGTTDPGTLLQLEGASAYLTLKNSTNEHTDGGAETRIIFEDHSNATLAQIQASHDGAADNTRGDLIFSTNNGTSLAEAIRINRQQFVGIGTINPGGSSTGAVVDIENTIAGSATEGGNIRLCSNDGAAIGDTHRLGVIEFAARDNVGGAIAVGAKIEAIAAEAWDATNNAANLDFYTSDGDEVQTKRMSISATGEITSTYATAVAAGTGFDTNTPVYKTQIDHIDGIIRTRIWIDLHPAASSIYSKGTVQAVLGDAGSGVANAYFTQVTAAKNGAIFYAKMSCLQAPTGGDSKVGLGAATAQLAEGTAFAFGGGVSEVNIANIGAGGFGSGADIGSKGESGQNPLSANLADYYLYLYNANAGASGAAYTAYTAGQFLIELHGTALN